MKQCSVCRQVLGDDQFYQNKKWRTSKCKKCYSLSVTRAKRRGTADALACVKLAASENACQACAQPGKVGDELLVVRRPDGADVGAPIGVLCRTCQRALAAVHFDAVRVSALSAWLRLVRI